MLDADINGTILEYAPLYHYLKMQKWDKNSERFFLYLLDRLNEETNKKGASMHFEERFALFEQIISDMAKGKKLNLMFTDRKYLYICIIVIIKINNNIQKTQTNGGNLW